MKEGGGIGERTVSPHFRFGIGAGQSILGDDGVGWKVAEAVSGFLSSTPCLLMKDDGRRIEVDCASLGGLSLMERMIGYERVILIDSMETGGNVVGTVKVFPLAALENPRLRPLRLHSRHLSVDRPTGGPGHGDGCSLAGTRGGDRGKERLRLFGESLPGGFPGRSDRGAEGAADGERRSKLNMC